MSTDSPDVPFNAELAWDLQDWSEAHQLDGGPPLDRDHIKRLAVYLTQKGYHNGEKAGIGSSLQYLEEAGAKLADEFLPVLDALRSKKKTT